MVMAQACSDFKTFFDTGLAVEEVVQLGILDKPEPAPKPKKVYFGNSNNLFGNANYTNLPNTSTNTTQAELVNQIAAQTSQPRTQPRTFAQFSAPLSAVLEKLVESDTLKPLTPTPLPQKLPASHNPNTYCAYHQNVGHLTDNCFRLCHAIQDLIDNKTLPMPPLKPNTVSNPLPKHSNTRTNFISISQPFDPSHYIIPATQPKPTVELPVEDAVCALETVEWDFQRRWEDLVQDFLAVEDRALITRAWPVALNPSQVEELEQGEWRQDWEEMMADPLGGYSLFALFTEPEPVEKEDEWEWEPEPNRWHWMDDSDPLDETSLAYLFREEEVVEEMDLMNPRMLSGLNVRTIVNLTRDTDVLERAMDYLFLPQEYIIEEFFPQPVIEILDEPNICVLDPEDLWGKSELVNVWMDGEELTVNKAMLDEGSLQISNNNGNNNSNFWNSLEEDSIWHALEMETLNETLEKTALDKGKRKADDCDFDFSNFWEDGFLVSSAVLEIMKRMKYLPGIGLGLYAQGVPEFPDFPGSNERFGLGYEAKKSDSAKKWRDRARAHATEMKLKEKEALYQGEPEPFVDLETKMKYPGFEIFANDTWESDEEFAKIEELSEALDWLEALEEGHFQSLFGGEELGGMMEGPAVLMLGNEEEIEDPSKLIVEAVVIYDNCTFVPHLLLRIRVNRCIPPV
ncbi:hypothetical protein RHMOL_Rhmol10G0175100 [Rhododendron molle]|uniref:Uncharacterized protein n=1 Tax=Rhododendron molle TaxID=49168 RepID=A0ACC0M4W5_RHOML|nr:hypothetical protein RHMOL_Rhmol10G0175100 [Rhododendron molle]